MSSNRNYRKPDLKVVMVGDTSVGKTCLVLRYIDRQFQESISTIGASFILKSWGYYSIAIWDTAGSERYTGMNNFYYRNAAAAILAFDLTDRNTFENLSAKYLPILNSLNYTKLKLVVGTKCDLLSSHKRQISLSEATQLTKSLNQKLYETTGFVPYFETSSKSGTNVDKMFEYVFEHFYPNGGSEPRPLVVENNVSLSTSIAHPEKSSCC